MTDHGHDEESHDSTGPGPASKGRLSRRQVMTASAVAAGVGLASIPARAGAAAGGQAVSLGVSGTTTVEFRGRVTQSGDSFISYGYLIKASNADDSALFADPTTPSETTALLTAYATGDLLARVTDMSVHSLDIVGTLTIYQRSQPGASFNDPSSFQIGTAVASYDMTLQDVLTVFAPAQGLPTLTGDMLQTDAATLSGPLAGQKFGRQGARLRFFATGLGALTDPTPPNSQLEIAGNWSIQ